MPLSLFHLHGDLKDLRFPRLLAALREDDFTGVFQATTRPAAAGAPADGAGEVTREVHFSAGHIAWAISTEREESLRAYLLRHRTLTEQQWAEAEDRAREGTLRQALIGLGIVDARELTQVEKGRAEEIVLALFSAREGEYRVRERQLSPGTPDLKIDPRPLILKGVLEGGDRGLILDEVGSLDTVYVVKRPVLEEAGLSLPGEFQSILRHIDGKRSIAQICSLTAMPDNFVCSVFGALSMIGAIRRNYEKTQNRARGEIVKGSEVTAAPAGTARAIVAPAAPAVMASRESVRPEPAEVEPAASLTPPPEAAEAAESVSEPATLPPISRLPFPGEGPVTPLSVEGGQTDEAEELEVEPEPELDPELEAEEVVTATADEEEPEAEPEPENERLPLESPAPAARVPITASRREAPAGAARVSPSVYDDAVPAHSSRPWFLLGGAAAVGFAALFLILMAQNPGDAGEVIQPVSKATEPLPSTVGDADDPDDAAIAEKAETPPPSPPSMADSSAPAPIAPPTESNILSEDPGGDRAGLRSGTGRESLASGDYLAAARYFGHEVAGRAGQYTIQLLTACQDDTVRRAVQSSRGSADLFILSTRLEGRDCYRVFWGKYSTATRAREALRRDVPSSFLQERSQPRITRLGG